MLYIGTDDRGPDVDLDTAGVYDSYGNRVDQARVDEAIENIDHAAGAVRH